MNDQDYVIIDGKKVITRWQTCISCKREIFTTQPSESAVCDECRKIDESHRGDGGYDFFKIFKKKQAIPDNIRWAVWERDNFTCKECGTRQNLSIDHIYPEARGGTLDMENLQTLCKRCNSRKGAR